MPNKDPTPPTGSLLRDSSWTITRRVIGALVMRELLTRYGRNNLGFLWLFIEPMLFVVIITLVWTYIRHVSASNLPIVAFALTGYSSILLWRNMPSRCIGALTANISLLYHRQVTKLDIFVARIVLETMAISTSFVALGIIFYAMEWVSPPEDVLQVLGGWALTAWFGAGLGLTIAGLADRMPPVKNLWPPLSYILMPLSGVAYIADALPENFRNVVLWLPMLNSLEYMREGWFGSLMRAHYDIPYVIAFNLILTVLGLALVRQIGVDTSEA